MGVLAESVGGRLDNLRVYGAMLRAALQSRMQYRGSFIAYVVTVLGFYAAQIAVIGVMLNRFHSIGGWKPGEVALLYCLLVLAQGLVSMVGSGLVDFASVVRDGTFDRTLLRPLSSLAQILVMRFEPAGTAHVIMGVLALFTANTLLDIPWTAMRIGFLFACVLGGAMILMAVRIAVAAVSFFTISNAGLQHLVVFSSREFLLYPVDIYSRPVRFLLTFFFPIAFVNFYPAHVFLDRSGEGLFHPSFVYMTLPVGAAALALAFWFWRFAVRNYTSTGS